MFCFLLSILLCSSTSTAVLANNQDHIRDEPILPIPLKSIADPDKAKLGELLFFDNRLSADKRLACASCHQLGSGGDDNLARGISISTEQHVVNTPSIFNAVYNFRQNWDGSATTLPEQIDMVMDNHHEFDNTWADAITELEKDKNLTDKFRKIYTDGLKRENIIDALVEFEKTLVTPNARFDRYLRNERNSLTKQEIEGYTIFKELGCVSCHQGVNIGGNLFQKFGVFYNYIAERGNISKSDYGRFNITNRQSDTYVFKVPSLRNIAVTAPYLHDGSATSLEEVIAIMGKTQLGKTLTEKEINSIKAFLNTLTGEYKEKPLDEQS